MAQPMSITLIRFIWLTMTPKSTLGTLDSGDGSLYCAQNGFCGGDNCVSWAVFG
jgi:hypothetical protein